MRDNENYWKRLRHRPVSRRGFLVGSGVAAAGGAAILAGCGDDDDDDTPTAAPGSVSPMEAVAAKAALPGRTNRSMKRMKEMPSIMKGTAMSLRMM